MGKIQPWAENALILINSIWTTRLFDLNTHRDHIIPVPNMQIGKNDKRTDVNKSGMFVSLACCTDHRKRQTWHAPHSGQQPLENCSVGVQTWLKLQHVPKNKLKNTYLHSGKYISAQTLERKWCHIQLKDSSCLSEQIPKRSAKIIASPIIWDCS